MKVTSPFLSLPSGVSTFSPAFCLLSFFNFTCLPLIRTSIDMHCLSCIPISSSSHTLLRHNNHNPFLSHPLSSSSRPSSCLPSKTRPNFTITALLSSTKESVLKDFHERKALKVNHMHTHFYFLSIFFRKCNSLSLVSTCWLSQTNYFLFIFPFMKCLARLFYVWSEYCKWIRGLNFLFFFSLLFLKGQILRM